MKTPESAIWFLQTKAVSSSTCTLGSRCWTDLAKPENQAIAHRCEFLDADFFAAVPAHADAIIMKHIIHDWDDPEATTILKNCRQALAGKPGARVLLVEPVISSGNSPELGKFIDLEMMVFPGGRERTEEEFRKLFASAGLRLSRIVPTASPVCAVEGVVA